MKPGCQLSVCLVLGAAVCSWLAAWGGETEVACPVTAQVVAMAMEKDGIWVNGQKQESPFLLKFRMVLSVKSPFCFVEASGKVLQYLEVTDSAGRKLAPAEFDLGWSMKQNESGGMAQACITGKSAELPRPDIDWLRLAGTFRITVARTEESPVYELPPVEGAAIHIPLPGADREEARKEDIVVAEDVPMGKLFLKEYGTLEEDGKKKIDMQIGLDVDTPFGFDSFQILNEKGDVVKVQNRGSSSISGSTSRQWVRTMRFENPGHVEKLRIRLLYRRPLDTVAVPVDVKMGLWGEVKKGK